MTREYVLMNKDAFFHRNNEFLGINEVYYSTIEGEWIND